MLRSRRRSALAPRPDPLRSSRRRIPYASHPRLASPCPSGWHSWLRLRAPLRLRPRRKFLPPRIVPGSLRRLQFRTEVRDRTRSPDPDRPHSPYSLPELIDVAERRNPDTRAAWQNARASASRLGIARADLLPALTAVVLANTTRDGVLFNEAFVRQTLGVFEPMLEVNYLVLDFGSRSARIHEARERLLGANFSFNRVTLDILFETSIRYYQLLNAMGQRDAAQVNFDNAETVRKAVEARLLVGLATLPDALEARAAAAQANFSLQAAIGDVDIRCGDLLSLLGAAPVSMLRVQPLAEIPTPEHLELNIEEATTQALAQRPEIGESVAERASARDEIRSARSAYLPTLDFQGQGGEVCAYGRQNQLNDTYAGPLEEWNVNLSLKWDLFDGGRRENSSPRPMRTKSAPGTHRRDPRSGRATGLYGVYQCPHGFLSTRRRAHAGGSLARLV